MSSSLEKEETGSDTKVPLDRGDSEDYDDEEQTDNQGKILHSTVLCTLHYCNKCFEYSLVNLYYTL
jgi:hypothetical protein